MITWTQHTCSHNTSFDNNLTTIAGLSCAKSQSITNYLQYTHLCMKHAHIHGCRTQHTRTYVHTHTHMDMYVRTHTHVWWTNFPESGFRVCPLHVELHHTGGNRNHYRYSETFRRPPTIPPWPANPKLVVINSTPITARLYSIKCPHPHTITPHIPPHTSC